MTARALITGATGFVGSRLCEVMALTETYRPRALVHTTGSAARISRYPIEFVIGDLCDAISVRDAMKDCDVVVHLARGSDSVLNKGLKNVLRTAHEKRVRRFVHVSSVAVYGDHPTPDSKFEQAKANPGNNAYGRMKLKQEKLVTRFGRRCKLPTVILRPPNIYGPHSHFTMNLLARIRKGDLPIVDGGRNPCSLVYVDNLIEAILLALTNEKAVNETFFVLDRQTVTWEQSLQDHAAMVGESVPRVRTGALTKPANNRVLIDSLKLTPRVLLSGEFRAMLRKIPLFAGMEQFLWNRFNTLPGKFKDAIRLRINGPDVIASCNSTKTQFSNADNIILAQGRTVAHSCDKISRLLGYKAPVSYQEGMKLTEGWLRFARLIP